MALSILDFEFTKEEIAAIRSVADACPNSKRFVLHKAANALELLGAHKDEVTVVARLFTKVRRALQPRERSER